MTSVLALLFYLSYIYCLLMDNQFLPIEPKKDTSITIKRQIERGAVSKAIYMVTDLFEDSEPLKSALRNSAVDILKDKGVQYTTNLKSLLILSREIGLVSDINIDILVRAINSIEESVNPSEKNVDLSNVLKINKDMNVVPDTDSKIDTIIEEGDKEETQVPSESENLDTATRTYKTVPEPVVTKKPERPTPSVSMSTTLDIGTRRKKILEVVRSKGQATIHEFTQSIQGCSSKTIQRELTSLVLSGTLKKTGERRWSKYSLR